MEMVNEYAPEHLLLAGSEAEGMVDQVRNAGSVFIGEYSPEAAGDYASGTNHALPTNGYAKAYSGVSRSSFTKTISFQQLSKEGLVQLSETIMTMAKAEGLDAHSNAIQIRMEK
jgi:histidinol dehydrogenase